MKKIALKGNIVLHDKILAGGVVVIEGERIEGVYDESGILSFGNVDFIDYRDHLISPGLIDIHLHGAQGKEVMDGEVESLQIIASHQARCGVTGFLAGTVASSLSSTLKVIDAVKRARKIPCDAEILGVHLEGPFLNLKRKGAQDPEFIKEISEDDFRLLSEASEGLPALLTLAPEVANNLSFVRRFKERGFVVAMGHSDATYEQALESFREGITHAAHLFNAWREFHPREPGNVGAVLDSDWITAEVIADGIHLHPAILRFVIAKKGPEKVCLITDSMKATGLGDGLYVSGNLKIVLKGNEARLEESGVLAGSVLTLNQAVKNIIAWTGLPVFKVINMASLNPARVMGFDGEMGSLEKGKRANIVVFDREFRVLETYLRGARVKR